MALKTVPEKKSHILSVRVKVAYSQMAGGRRDRAGPTAVVNTILEQMGFSCGPTLLFVELNAEVIY